MIVFIAASALVIVLSVFSAPIGELIFKKKQVRGRGFAPGGTDAGALAAQDNNSGRKVLLVFAIITGLTTIATGWKYGRVILQNGDLLLNGFWLFLFMIAGMFVQVISTNYKNGNELFKVTATQLIYPTLFSIIIFYPIWTLASDNKFSISYFLIYSAFLNGYFWETIVSNVKKPD